MTTSEAGANSANSQEQPNGNVAEFIAQHFGAPGCIVLVSNADGSVGLTAHGVNHERANEMLSVGIFINLDQHYNNVRAGHAGTDAAAMQRELDAHNGLIS